jgi:hypothetical protein
LDVGGGLAEGVFEGVYCVELLGGDVRLLDQLLLESVDLVVEGVAFRLEGLNFAGELFGKAFQLLDGYLVVGNADLQLFLDGIHFFPLLFQSILALLLLLLNCLKSPILFLHLLLQMLDSLTSQLELFIQVDYLLLIVPFFLLEALSMPFYFLIFLQQQSLVVLHDGRVYIFHQFFGPGSGS